MFQVAYNYAESWPDNGVLHVDVRLKSEITVMPKIAQQRAKGYLTFNVGLFVTTDTPVLILGGSAPIWRVPAYLRLRSQGKIAMIGAIDVNAQTSEVYPLTEQQILAMQNLSNDLAARLTATAN